MRTRRRTLAAALGATLLLAACTDDDGPTLETAEVTSGPVVETVAAAAQLAPAAAVTVTAPLGGEVVELLVADGDEVEAGQELVRLSSESLEQQIAQAEAALAAADSFGGLGGLGGVDVSGLAGGLGGLAGGVPTVDLSPVFGALAGQFEATVGPLLGVLEDSGTEIGIPNVVTSVLASYRGYDTLGEVTVIFTAGVGVMLLLGGRRRKKKGERR